jgi:hypothetical protein
MAALMIDDLEGDCVLALAFDFVHQGIGGRESSVRIRRRGLKYYATDAAGDD